MFDLVIAAAEVPGACLLVLNICCNGTGLCLGDVVRIWLVLPRVLIGVVNRIPLCLGTVVTCVVGVTNDVSGADGSVCSTVAVFGTVGFEVLVLAVIFELFIFVFCVFCCILCVFACCLRRRILASAVAFI